MTLSFRCTACASVEYARQVGKILDIFQSHGHAEVDTARVYGGGTSEEYLGKLDWKKRGLIMETKLCVHGFDCTSLQC